MYTSTLPNFTAQRLVLIKTKSKTRKNTPATVIQSIRTGAHTDFKDTLHTYTDVFHL